MSNEARRLAYLDAMGVTVWRQRSTDPAVHDGTSSERDDQASQAVHGDQLAASEPAHEPPPPALTPDRNTPEIAAMDWDTLAASVARCQRCPLHAERTQGVFGVGNPEADWLFIGEAPGAEEDRQGEPFVGRAGQLLDAMLAAVGRSRESVYIANVIKSRPPGNRNPAAEEIEACLPYLRRQIQLISPRLVMLCGRISAQSLLDSTEPVGRLRGQVHRLPGFGIPAVVTYHPAYLLREGREKRKVWEDLRLARRTLKAMETAS